MHILRSEFYLQMARAITALLLKAVLWRAQPQAQSNAERHIPPKACCGAHSRADRKAPHVSTRARAGDPDRERRAAERARTARKDTDSGREDAVQGSANKRQSERCAEIVTSGRDALKETNTGDAPNIEASRTLKLKCNPLCLPPAPYEAPRVPIIRNLSREAAMQVTDYYRRIHERRKAAYFKLKGHKRK